ncbi:GntR family transcriptional regulator [Puniceibacterium sp. IMCC21224]|uniref:GntR family transcriptional regulator n=1 Tax=Puniceibacterium sp. IMCC21224 TaxID=1618204 RepID=UPI00065DA0D7|nr:GntR family transcriptional regulator [Puniceibacterium sp. IMCC21224]KMK64973.1 transcriptional regulator, GntR family [Puniceibacterium sp. IMCC21224]
MRPAVSSVDRTPVYSTIADHIRTAIDTGTLPEGTVLLEGPLAVLFRSSRSPVKQALLLLESEGRLARFEGRGLVVGQGSAPQRRQLTPSMIGLPEHALAEVRAPAWQSLWYEFERDIILRSLFGEGRINELALARHFDVGRTVARDLLLHAQTIGIVARDDRERWSLVPFDLARFANLYELRLMLEPAAIQSAVGRVAPSDLDKMVARCKSAAEHYPQVEGELLDRLETDLHIDCVAHAANPELPRALWHSRSMLLAGKHIQDAASRMPARIDPFMGEHLKVLRAMSEGRPHAARTAMEDHLESSRDKAAHRFEMFRSQSEVYPLGYVT